MKYTHSTHLLEFGYNSMPELAIICGNYCRRLRHYVSGHVKLAPWQRIPQGTTKVIPCVEPIVEVIEEVGQRSYASIMY